MIRWSYFKSLPFVSLSFPPRLIHALILRLLVFFFVSFSNSSSLPWLMASFCLKLFSLFLSQFSVLFFFFFPVFHYSIIFFVSLFPCLLLSSNLFLSISYFPPLLFSLFSLPSPVPYFPLFFCFLLFLLFLLYSFLLVLYPCFFAFVHFTPCFSFVELLWPAFRSHCHIISAIYVSS